MNLKLKCFGVYGWPFENLVFNIYFLYLIANCPAGSYYSAQNDACVECPLGTYQPVQGQTECICCGKNLTTSSNGTLEESDCIGSVNEVMF